MRSDPGRTRPVPTRASRPPPAHRRRRARCTAGPGIRLTYPQLASARFTFIAGSPRTRIVRTRSRDCSSRASCSSVRSAKANSRSVVGTRCLSQPDLARHAHRDAVGLAAVPVIVEVKDDEIVLLDEIAFELIRRVGADLVDLVLVREERGLVGDHHVASGGRSPLQHVERRHHRRRDPFHARVRIAADDVVDGLRHPGDADIGFDPIDDLPAAA